MPDELLLPFMERFGMEGINQGYGQSELMLLLSKMDTPKHRWKPNALGRLSIDAELKLLNDQGEEVATGEVGEFSVKPNAPFIIFNGYFNNPEATANAYSGEWFDTGDLGMRDADGDYFFVDRKKDYIRLKGRNISSLQVESIAMRHPSIKAAAVYGVPSDHLKSEDEIKLDVILNPGETMSAEQVAEFINDNAPYFCVPRYIDFVDELPYTPTNKVQKYKLREGGLSKTAWDRHCSDFVLKR
jgi:crotonobetaine/carnitine-CoA ligase